MICFSSIFVFGNSSTISSLSLSLKPLGPLKSLPLKPLPLNPLGPLKSLPLNPLRPLNPLGPLNPLPLYPLLANPLPLNPLPLNYLSLYQNLMTPYFFPGCDSLIIQILQGHSLA